MGRQGGEREAVEAVAEPELEPARQAAGKASRTGELGGASSIGSADHLLTEPGAAALPGQVDKLTFLARLSAAAAEQVKAQLGGGIKGSLAAGQIERALTDLKARSAGDLERLMNEFAPPTRSARSADAAIALLLAELRRVVSEYQATGEMPARAKQLFAIGLDDGPTRFAAARPRDALAAADEPVDALAETRAGSTLA